MTTIERKHCLIRGTPDLEHLFTMKNIPISMYCVDTPPEDDVRADMVWTISRAAGCIQLSRLVPLNVLYAHAHGSGAVGGVWRDHHVQFCDFIASYGIRRPVEVGAGHGALAQQYVEAHTDASWVIVEPNAPSWIHDRVTIVPQFFDATFDLPEDVDAIVHSHFFEHAYDPREFLENVARKLRVGQKHLFSIPRLDRWLERKYNNALNFEHTVLLTEGMVDELLQVTGFVILEKRQFGQDHSMFYATERAAEVAASASRVWVCEYERNRRLFLDYVRSEQDVVSRLNLEIRKHAGDVFLFGGHVFSQFLIEFGLDVSRVVCILDNDTKKHGKRLYGTTLLVKSPGQMLWDADRPLVVLRAGAYRDEIAIGILEVRNDVRFIE